MKNWIAAEAWSVIKCIAPLRRSRHIRSVHENLAFKRCALWVWRLTCPSADAHGSSSVPLLRPVHNGLFCFGTIVDADRAMRAWRWNGTLHTAMIFWHQFSVRSIAESDRKRFLDEMALSASSALDH